MKFESFRFGIVSGFIVSAALVGCGGSEKANAPTGGTTTSAPGPTAPADAGTPKITEKPAEPTPTPKEATDKGGTEKGKVKKEEPPKGA